MKQFYPNRFKDKVIILTGAARGIGEATAIRAAKEGAKLVLADRLKEEESVYSMLSGQKEAQPFS
ncbi:MAG: SDR family NAD(P)-dependent oxidoreductase [Enterocloster clostridioformis]